MLYQTMHKYTDCFSYEEPKAEDAGDPKGDAKAKWAQFKGQSVNLFIYPKAS